jgi:Triosephosphate isomerase
MLQAQHSAATALCCSYEQILFELPRNFCICSFCICCTDAVLSVCIVQCYKYTVVLALYQIVSVYLVVVRHRSALEETPPWEARAKVHTLLLDIVAAGNWKENPCTLKEATDLTAAVAEAAKQAQGVDVAVFPSFPFIQPCNEKAGSVVKVGGQVCAVTLPSKRIQALLYCAGSGARGLLSLFVNLSPIVTCRL